MLKNDIIYSENFQQLYTKGSAATNNTQKLHEKINTRIHKPHKICD